MIFFLVYINIFRGNVCCCCLCCFLKQNICETPDEMRWAATWQNQQSDCAPSEDSDQPGHPPSLIRVFAVRMKKAWVLSYPLSAQRRLWSDWADAQADLSLRWAHTHFVGFVMLRLRCLRLESKKKKKKKNIAFKTYTFSPIKRNCCFSWLQFFNYSSLNKTRRLDLDGRRATTD